MYQTRCIGCCVLPLSIWQRGFWAIMLNLMWYISMQQAITVARHIPLSFYVLTGPTQTSISQGNTET